MLKWPWAWECKWRWKWQWRWECYLGAKDARDLASDSISLVENKSLTYFRWSSRILSYYYAIISLWAGQLFIILSLTSRYCHLCYNIMSKVYFSYHHTVKMLSHHHHWYRKYYLIKILCFHAQAKSINSPLQAKLGFPPSLSEVSNNCQMISNCIPKFKLRI